MFLSKQAFLLESTHSLPFLFLVLAAFTSPDDIKITIDTNGHDVHDSPNLSPLLANELPSSQYNSVSTKAKPLESKDYPKLTAGTMDTTAILTSLNNESKEIEINAADANITSQSPLSSNSNASPQPSVTDEQKAGM